MAWTPRDFLAACQAPRRDKLNQWRILLWMFTWMATWLGLLLALEHEWLEPGLPATAAALVSSAFAVGTAFAYRRYLREADELRRKIELDALALAFAVGALGGLVFTLLARTGAVPDAGLLEVVMAMMVTYSLGVVVGQWRYS